MARVAAGASLQVPLPPQCQVAIVEPPKAVPSKGTLVFLHGWPDSVELWAPTQQRFASLGYKCAAVGLPGFGSGSKKNGRQGYTFAETDELLMQAVSSVAQGEKITLIGHDWGSFFVSRLERTPINQMVKRYVKLDVGEGFDASLVSVLAILSYQIPAAVAFSLGGRPGGLLTRLLTRAIGAPAPTSDSYICWPYPEFHRVLLRRERLIPGARPAVDQRRPLLYIYGTRKPMQFHSAKWVDGVGRRRDGSRVFAMDSDHWFVVRGKTQELFWRHLQDFLEEGQASPAPAGLEAKL